MIEIANLSYTYEKSAEPTLKSFSMTLCEGEIVALKGQNGAGKTTLARLITGMLPIKTGDVLVDGQSVKSMRLYQIGRLVGYVFQEPSRQLFLDTVKNEIAFGLKNLAFSNEEIAARTTRYAEILRLNDLLDAFPGTLSRGEQQRVVLAAVMSMGTKYLILDEPTNGLDMKTRRSLARLIKELKEIEHCGVLLISHDDDFIAQTADREVRL